MKMKSMTLLALAALGTHATLALAASDMANMPGMAMSPPAQHAKPAAGAQLTDAVVRKVDPATGMVTIKHGPLENVGMPAMTMAFKTRDAAMAAQVHEGDKVKVRVENVNGTMTIVRLEKQQ
ncbi:RND transporter MFP subunit [Pandoraea pneumonica]|uniref:RND transporter MFP subunit n=1 Tax=Pandoraea pneumonica TaxID=2508299 RepID=A0A5E4SQE3_9BURK|nr:copper-binding protein [Pandoraea pneumonica]VVD76564.1 RND transporter MFP subunit [Pandoraea pneumonica]